MNFEKYLYFLYAFHLLCQQENCCLGCQACTQTNLGNTCSLIPCNPIVLKKWFYVIKLSEDKVFLIDKNVIYDVYNKCNSSIEHCFFIPVLSSDCVLHIRDGEFSWQDKGSHSTKPSKNRSNKSINSSTNTRASDTMTESQESHDQDSEDDRLLERSDESGQQHSKTLELKQINIQITKVFIFLAFNC